jgi:hypothetical protein
VSHPSHLIFLFYSNNTVSYKRKIIKLLTMQFYPPLPFLTSALLPFFNFFNFPNQNPFFKKIQSTPYSLSFTGWR